ncbi:MAG: hypothetical protein IIY15_02000 [Flavobacteriales bacterium]|nr:hypothetical protein [Flavobacteriales bacterium]
MSEKEFDKERIKEIIAECYIKGYSKARTMARVQNLTGEKMYLKKLNKLLSEILESWGDNSVIKDQKIMRALELKKIDALEAELWQAWEESKSMDEGGGDARYLSEIRRCNEQRSKLLGLNLTHSQQETTSATLVWNECKNYGTDDKTNRGS